jgi:hypothetical protein
MSGRIALLRFVSAPLFMRDLARRGIPGERGILDYSVSVAPDSQRAA